MQNFLQGRNIQKRDADEDDRLKNITGVESAPDLLTAVELQLYTIYLRHELNMTVNDIESVFDDMKGENVTVFKHQDLFNSFHDWTVDMTINNFEKGSHLPKRMLDILALYQWMKTSLNSKHSSRQLDNRDLDDSLLKDITGVDSAANLMNAVNYLKHIRNMTLHDTLSKLAEVEEEEEGGQSKDGVTSVTGPPSRPDLLASFQEWTRNAALVLQDLTGAEESEEITGELDTFVKEANDFLANLTLPGNPLSYTKDGQNQTFSMIGQFTNLISTAADGR